MSDTDVTDRAARWLGYSGLLPFVSSALGARFLSAETAGLCAEILLAYGCVILSFLGGIGWGIAIVDKRAGGQALLAGVIPSLLAGAAWLLSGGPALVMLVLGFAAIYQEHKAMAGALALPSWFMTLRLHLSIGAILSLLFGLL